jgi:dihydropyrimidinase
MYPQKGTIGIGSDADIVVWDPNLRHTISAQTHHMHVDYNLFEGTKVKGKPVIVFVRGQKLVDSEEWVGKKGSGKFIHRKPHAQII